jgi:hypothetical protein
VLAELVEFLRLPPDRQTRRATELHAWHCESLAS